MSSGKWKRDKPQRCYCWHTYPNPERIKKNGKWLCRDSYTCIYHGDGKTKRTRCEKIPTTPEVNHAKLDPNKPFGKIVEKYDTAIYDEKPSDDYVQGFCVIAYIPYNDKSFLALEHLVRENTFNLMAYIPTPYTGEVEYPFGIVYLIVGTKIELIYLKERLSYYQDNKRVNIYYFEKKEPKVNPVWFHKGWVRDSYDPTKCDTKAKQYNLIKNNAYLCSKIHKSTLKSLRRAYCMQRECYAPKSEKDKDCKNAYRGFKSKKICTFCAASKNGKKYTCENPRKKV